MKERPILFSGPMVRAILDGRKTQTRRVVKPQPITWHHDDRGFEFSRTDDHRPVFADTFARYYSPYGQPGDRLWVRETWRVAANVLLATEGKPTSSLVKEIKRRAARADLADEDICYAADEYPGEHPGEYRPSIFMPREASRITLEITDVRIERLQDISEDDARMEGIKPYSEGGFKHYTDTNCFGTSDPVVSFRSLWESINGEGSWHQNPWVWVVKFKVVK